MNHLQTVAQNLDLELSLDPLDDFVRVPGLLRRWELEQVVTGGAEYRIEEAGEMSDKTPVFAVYRRELPPPAEVDVDGDVGVPVRLTFDSERMTVGARLLPISDEEPLMAVLVVGNDPSDAGVLARVRDHLLRSASRSASAGEPDVAPSSPALRGGAAR